MQAVASRELRHLLGPDAVSDTLWAELRRFEVAAAPLIVASWGLDQRDHLVYWQIVRPYDEEERARYNQRCAQVVDALAATLGDDLGACAAAFLLHPQFWRASYHRSHFDAVSLNTETQIVAELLAVVAERCAMRHPPLDWSSRVCRRLLTLFGAVGASGYPDFDACLGFLVLCDDASSDVVDALAFGDWEGAWALLARLGRLDADPAPDRLRTEWGYCGGRHAVAVLQRWFRHNRLEAGSFQRLLETTPNSLSSLNAALGLWVSQPPEEPEQRRFADTLRHLMDQVLWGMLCDFRPEAWPALAQLSYLSGGRYLLRLAEETARQGLATLRGRSYHYERAADVLAHLFALLARRDDDSDALIPLLRQIDRATLCAILPHATAYQSDICAALGWEGSVEVLRLLQELASSNPGHSADPAAGVVQRSDVLAVAERMRDEELRALLDAMGNHQPEAVTLVRAALGWNRKEVRRLLGRRNQLAARALALLPLEQPDELFQRYLLLRRFQREANSSPAGRKVYERAAARAGLAILALHAGYADATRLGWAMEDRLGSERVSLHRQWEIEGYTLTLVLRDAGPAIEVRNARRALKRTPTAIVRDYAYREVKDTLEQAQEMEQRLRSAFQEAMRNGQPLSGEEIALLSRNPLAVCQLERLVLIDDSGAAGVLHAEAGALEGTHGELVKITGSLRIAHPYTLAEAGTLAAWQAEIVRRQIVQPFRQVFRELYVLTPAEIEARFASARLAGRRMRGRQAAAVLANMGWLFDGHTARKPLYHLGYAAHFETGSYGYDDDDGETTGSLWFWPIHWQHSRSEQRIPLDQIPPLVFSEVLRDLDLVTVIAHQSDEFGTSREVLQQRGDLVRATAAALGWEQVRVEEPFVHVRGTLTSYRLHLATGAIYMASGQYLCIVPERKAQQALYLPFAGGGEPVVSEVVSKVLLLCNDAQLTDASILAQITAAAHV